MDFDKRLLILSAIKEGEIPTVALLFYVPFWVQVYNLPIGFMFQMISQGIGNFLYVCLEEKI